jgi:hypothetical protein
MGCMGTTTLREKHKGTSTFGGRYASHDRTESSVSLRPDLAEATSEEPLNGAEALSVARVLARHALRRSKLGSHLVDDIAQDSLTSVINSRTRGTVGALTPGLIANATRQAVSHHLSTINGVRHEEFKARQKLDGQVDDLSQELGRGLTDAEIDVMAERIRDTTTRATSPPLGSRRSSPRWTSMVKVPRLMTWWPRSFGAQAVSDRIGSPTT